MNRKFDTGKENLPADDRFSTEMRGHIDLGMQHESLRLARRFLKREPLEPGAFIAAIDALLVHCDRLKRWAPLVEVSHARPSKDGQLRARSAMLSFWYSLNEFGKAAAFIPKRFDGSVDAREVAFVIDLLLNLNRLEDARVWVRKVKRSPNLACDEWVGGLLQSRLAEFYARDGDWERAIQLLEPLRTHRGIAESVILGIVGLRVAQALRAVNEGFAALRGMTANPDTELAVTLPGNEDSRWNKTEMRLKRLEKRLWKALPKERQRELGI
ncbi:MAG TPA: hypothetical protein VEL06_10560 [Haliangiales bacterium]|nr:hypothetical protein [Haliangiales bacterium]